MHTQDRKAPTRRRVLFIGAAFGAAALAPGMALASAQAKVARWRGQALGAHATIELVGAPQDVADEAFAAVEAEIRRLEASMSLYRADSELRRLNREGRLDGPSADLLAVLSLSAAAHERTDGLFDPTVQPLFALYAEHFARGDADPAGPSRPAVEAALGRVGLKGVRFDGDRIAFDRPGMALTLNGIAQGYVTDRVAALLRARGFSNMLLDIGEIAAVGAGPGGTGWRVGISDGHGGIAGRLSLADRAVATSAPAGTTLDPDGRVGHIFHPRKGLVPAARARATVVADSAAVADALSTAAVLMDDAGIAALASSDVEIHA